MGGVTPLIALHWSGSTPGELAAALEPLVADLPVRLVLPRGTLPRRDGWSWFPPGYYTDPDARAELLAATADRLAAELPDEPVVVTGLSQGGDLSFALAARHPDRVRAALPLLGLFPEPLWPADGGRVPPIHAFHGEDDAQVPIATARATAAGLAARGVPVTLHTYPGADHDFPPAMRADWRDALARILQSSPASL